MNEDQNKQPEPPERIWIDAAPHLIANASRHIYVEPPPSDLPIQSVEYVRANLAQPRTYHCSCGAACTAEEYIHHYFELKHDRGEMAQLPDAQRIAEVRHWIGEQIAGIHRSSLTEASRGALNAFQQTQERLSLLPTIEARRCVKCGRLENTEPDVVPQVCDRLIAGKVEFCEFAVTGGESERRDPRTEEIWARHVDNFREDDVADLSQLHTVSIAEIAARPNQTFKGKAPNLFEVWWKGIADNFVGADAKIVAQAAWYACAESLGVYDDQR